MPTAFRALSTSIASTSLRQSIIKPTIQRNVLSRSKIPSIRFFSLFPRLQQQQEAEESFTEPTGKEFTKYQELSDAGLISPRVINTIINDMKIHTMTDVQKLTVNHCLDGSDVIAQARTGTGKTLAFLLPIVQRILRDPELENRSRRAYDRASPGDIRAVIVSPTRELAEQIAVEAKRVVQSTAVKVQTAVGGTQKSRHLRMMQQEGCHILVGTPGRILDICSDRNTGVSLQNVETFVLDEADRLLDVGFAPAVEEMASMMPRANPDTGVPRQNLMFSATVPKSVISLVRKTLRPDFKFIRTIDPNEPLTHERIPQNVIFSKGLQNQIPIIMEIAHNAIQAHKRDPATNRPFKAIVFFGSTAEVNMTFEAFSKMRDPNQPRSIFAPHPLEPCRIYQMNGKLDQSRRTRETQGFRTSESAILFSTDVAARGMDFPDVTHVIQIGLPKSSEDYTHRLGRTGRAGKQGEGWLILNQDERKEIAYKMRDSGVNLKEATLVTADLDMTKGAQIPSHIAKLLKLVEVGVKSVPYALKAATYSALLGVLAQQNPNRHNQDQVDMMNELAKFGWGMTEPPPLPRSLVSKLRLDNVRGLRIEERPQRDFNDRDGGRGGFGGRDGGRDRGYDRNFGRGESSGGFGDRGSSRSFGDRQPAPSGVGVFGGGEGGDPFARMGMDQPRRGQSSRGGQSGGRGGRRY